MYKLATGFPSRGLLVPTMRLAWASTPVAAPNALRRYMSHGAASRSGSFPALFVRGGTSNGLVVFRKDLPRQREQDKDLPLHDELNKLHEVLCAVMGSPDQYGRQLDGMGTATSPPLSISTDKTPHVIIGQLSLPHEDHNPC